MKKPRPRFDVIAVLAGAIFLAGCTPDPPPTAALPHLVGTVAEGYPFALGIKTRLAEDAYLASAVVELARKGNDFQVVMIAYDFVSKEGKGRVFAVDVDNLSHQAFVAMDSAEIPANPRLRPEAWPPLDLATISKEVPEVLLIAGTNGLSEFCSMAGGKGGIYGLKLSNADKTAAAWRVFGDMRDREGNVASLRIKMDARTGSVLSHTLEKSGGAL